MNRTQQFSLAAGFALLLGASVSAQEVWSLQRCIGYAQEQNLTIKQAQANVRTTQLAESQAKASRLPNVSGSVNLGEQFGRTIDPTTNQFSTTAVGFSSLGLNAGVPLFNGGQIHHQVKQARYNTDAAEADAAQSSNTLALQVAQAYLTVLLNREQLKNAQNRVAQSQRQLENTQKLIDAGTMPMAEKFTVIAQIASNEQQAVVAQNNLDLSYLSLKQLLYLDPSYELTVETPAIPLPAASDLQGLSLAPVYTLAQQSQPNVRAADLRIQSAQEGVAVAKAAYYPSVSAFANLSSNYSSLYQKYNVTGNVIERSRPAKINDIPVTVTEFEPEVLTNKVGVFDQFDLNFGQAIGLSVNVPIYQNGRTRLSVERARLGVLNAELQQNQVQQQLKNDIQTALANARSAQKQLEAAQRTFEANQTAYANTEKRHALGAVNTLELTTAKNNLDIAENNLTVARYDYIFRVKILDFYQGKPLVLN